MARRTGDETRALLLKIGMQMLLERGVSAGVQHIRLQEVLRRAGLTTGAAYRLWADQTDYQRDLAVAMVRFRLAPPIGAASHAARAAITAGRPIDDVIRAAAATHVLGDTLGDNDSRDAQAFLIALALRTAADTWPELQEASRERHEESVAQFTQFYSELMAAYGFRMRRPHTVEDFTEAMAALGEGFAIRSLQGLSHPVYTFTEDDEAPSGEWSLFALSARGLVREFMVHDSEEPAALDDAVDAQTAPASLEGE